jgi:hypothetical protein
MGGYRSLKRVLGESNLERKCRWLFGLCVGGLIVLAFFSVDWIAENLINNTYRPLEVYTVVAILFGLMIYPFIWLSQRLEQRWKKSR